MKIEVAPSAGFCFGVERAVETAFAHADSSGGKKIYTLGKLIHNPSILKTLENKGVIAIDHDSLEQVINQTGADNQSTVIIRTHGVTKDIYEKLKLASDKNPYFSYVDCTCPNVRKIHDIVTSSTREDTMLVIIGDPTHPEVIGIKSFAAGDVVIFDDPEKIEIDKTPQKDVVMVAQTTQAIKKWKISKKFLQKLCTNSFIFDTICNATEKRQSETERLAEKSDIMIVIGGRGSSNTQKLFAIAADIQNQSFLIENADELPIEKLKNVSVAGVTAGASTPGGLIEEVLTKMAELNETIEKQLESEALTDYSEKEAANSDSDANFTSASFESLLEDSLKTLNTGEIVKGIITSVTPNEIHVDLEAKVTGIIPFAEITDNTSYKLEENFKAGEEIEAMVARVSDLDGVATLSKKRADGVRNWSKISEAYQSGEILEGKVTAVVRGGVILSIDSVRTFVPASHTGVPKEGDLNSLLNTTQKAKIIEVDNQKRHAYASIRGANSELRQAMQEKFWADIEVGKMYTGKIKSMMTYGVFVDLGGVDGMVHTSELSWKRIKNPAEVVSVGEEITVKIKSVDTDDKGKKRISLTLKDESNDPWNLFTAKYSKDDVCQAKIVSMMPFGAFAEVIPGADGLIHISQICEQKINHPADVLKKDQIVDVKITEIDQENRKISLSILALLRDEERIEPSPDPAIEAKPVAETVEEQKEEAEEKVAEAAAEQE